MSEFLQLDRGQVPAVGGIFYEGSRWRYVPSSMTEMRFFRHGEKGLIRREDVDSIYLHNDNNIEHAYIHAFREFLGRKIKGLFISFFIISWVSGCSKVFPIYFFCSEASEIFHHRAFWWDRIQTVSLMTSIVSTCLWLSNKNTKQNKMATGILGVVSHPNKFIFLFIYISYVRSGRSTPIISIW